MGKKSGKVNKFKIIIGIFIVVISIALAILNSMYHKGTRIKYWDNYYNENNIVFFYEDSINEKLKKLDEKYKIKDYVNNEEKEFDRVLKATNIINQIVEKDDVKSTGLKSAYDILEKKNDSKKVSFRDMAIIARDIINCSGVKSRIGIFRKGNAQFQNDSEYYVIEYWSTEYNKWVMVDFADQGYFMECNEKLSAIELLSKNIKKTPYLGNTNQKDYKNNIIKYLDSYTLQIENSNSKTRSNCSVTYIKTKDALEIKFKNKFAQPTIFTEQTKLFEKSPFDSLVGSDEKAYLLVCASNLFEYDDKDKNTNNAEENKIETRNIIGEKILICAFKDDKVMDSYYVNVNGAGYEEISNYKEIQLEKGTTTIDLSLDGQTTLSNVTIEKN